MTHDEIRDRLQDFMDGALDTDAAREMESHIDSCHTCREEIDRLRTTLVALSELPRSIEPEHDLWPAIEYGMDQQPGFGSRTVWSIRYVLAAAAIALIALSATVTAVIVGTSGAPTGFANVVDPAQLMVSFQRSESTYLQAAVRARLPACGQRRSDHDPQPQTLRDGRGRSSIRSAANRRKPG